MRNIFIFLFIISFAESANLLTHNIYERSDSVDIMLSFDSPYGGKISQKKDKNIITLTLSNLVYDRTIKENVNSDILQAITIKPNNDNINVIIKSQNSIATIASKTADGFGLRIRTKPTIKTTIKKVGKPTSSKTTLIAESSKNLIDWQYVGTILLLAIMILFMFWIIKKINMKRKQAKENNQNIPNNEINILHQKQIDVNNSVVLLGFQGKKYLVMSGNSNLLLEKFSKDNIKDDENFEKSFEDNRKKLDKYLKINEQEEADDYRSKLERY